MKVITETADSLLRHGNAHQHLSRSFPVFCGETATELYPGLPTAYIWHLATLVISEIEENDFHRLAHIETAEAKLKVPTKNCLDQCSSCGGTHLLVGTDSRLGGTLDL
jgi:hypothetical protein